MLPFYRCGNQVSINSQRSHNRPMTGPGLSPVLPGSEAQTLSHYLTLFPSADRPSGSSIKEPAIHYCPVLSSPLRAFSPELSPGAVPDSRHLVTLLQSTGAIPSNPQIFKPSEPMMHLTDIFLEEASTKNILHGIHYRCIKTI